MKLESVAGMIGIRRHCVACRHLGAAWEMWCDMDDANRWRAWYCSACTDRGYAKKTAAKRKREANKAAKNAWKAPVEA